MAILLVAPPGLLQAGRGGSADNTVYTLDMTNCAEFTAGDAAKILNVPAAFKDKLPQGAYSDIMGLGDEAVWTDVNGTLTVRKGNIIVQVLAPAGKLVQIKVAQAFLAKF